MSLITRNGGKVKLAIGSHNSFTRKFTEKDIRDFANFIQDEDPIHFKQDAFKSMGFEKTFVYGMMPTCLFTKLYLITFISPVYLSQSVKFSMPIYVDEDLEIKCVVSDLEITKSNKIKCTLDSTVTKLEKKTVAFAGTGVLMLMPDTVELVK